MLMPLVLPIFVTKSSIVVIASNAPALLAMTSSVTKSFIVLSALVEECSTQQLKMDIADLSYGCVRSVERRSIMRRSTV